MIKLTFRKDKDILNFAVVGREIFYKDKVWSNGIRLIPQDPNIAKIVIMSRNRIPHVIKAIAQAMSKKDKEEYEACKNEEELADKIRLDCKKKGLVEIK